MAVCVIMPNLLTGVVCPDLDGDCAVDCEDIPKLMLNSVWSG
jgi:hypothetical protein